MREEGVIKGQNIRLSSYVADYTLQVSPVHKMENITKSVKVSSSKFPFTIYLVKISFESSNLIVFLWEI